MNLKSVIEFHRQKVMIDLVLLEKDGVERYIDSVKYAEERIEGLGYSKSLLYMNKNVFDMIFEKNAIDTFKLSAS